MLSGGGVKGRKWLWYSKVRYLSCKTTTDSLKLKIDLSWGKMPPWDRTTLHDSLLVRKFYVQTILRGYFKSEFVKVAMQASPELGRFSTWPPFSSTGFTPHRILSLPLHPPHHPNPSLPLILNLCSCFKPSEPSPLFLHPIFSTMSYEMCPLRLSLSYLYASPQIRYNFFLIPNNT